MFLDERVSKIVLPSTQDMETEALDPENLAILMEEESEESEDAGILQIFVGSAESEVQPDTTWAIDEDEENYFDFDSEDDEENEITVAMPLQITPQQASMSAGTKSTESPSVMVEVNLKKDTDFEDEWEEVDWNEVTLSDILGETDDYFVESDDELEKEHGDSLGMWLDETIPEPLSLGHSQDESMSSNDFSFEALMNDEFSSEFDPLADASEELESSKEVVSEDRISIELDDDLPSIRVETEWWQHPVLVFFVALLSVMTLFMLLLQFFGH